MLYWNVWRVLTRRFSANSQIHQTKNLAKVSCYAPPTFTCTYSHAYTHTRTHTHFSHEGQVRHYHIKQDESLKYYISEKHRFPTIKELIEYHKLNGGGLVTRLRRPPAQLTPNLHTLSPLFGKLRGLAKSRLLALMFCIADSF